MKKYFSHINTAKLLIKKYDGKIPFNQFAKDFFKQNKKYGSKDRKSILDFSYTYFRACKFFPTQSFEEKIGYGFFLIQTYSTPFLNWFNVGLNEKISLSFQEKINYLAQKIDFSWLNQFQFTSGITKEEFVKSIFTLPKTFFRLRNCTAENVIKKLDDVKVDYMQLSETSFSVGQGVNLDKFFLLDNEIVIQDFNSQNVQNYFPIELQQVESLEIFDCCAGSGGKSILANDFYPQATITANDLRGWILNNLQDRFRKASIHNYNLLNIDLAKNKNAILNEKFHLIIVDAPCSGSGTWHRTPERLTFFTEKELSKVLFQQQTIVKNVVKSLADNGFLLYITCSLFAKENENIVQEILKEKSMQLINQQILSGTSLSADSLFVCLLKKR